MTNSSSTTPGARPASVGAQGEDNAGRPQPVPLEVPVTVNGARTVEGSDKREPFSETTLTVLVFGNGAVIRLASTVTAGQLLFLTNDRTKKEVVCQVVKSKNYRNVSGYVELEFTEAIPGFWGMRFPERAAGQPSAPVAAATKPVAPPAPAPRIETPASSVPQTPRPAPIVVPAARTETIAPSAQTSPALNLPSAPQPKPVATFPSSTSQSSYASGSGVPNPSLPKAPGLTDGHSALTSSVRISENKPAGPSTTKPPGVPINAQTSSSDALRRESERLQEQLASMLFAASSPAKHVQSAPAPPPAHKPIPELPAKVVEIAKPQAPVARVAPPLKNISNKLESSLDAEEVKVPSWLEPLARNVATHAQNEIAAKEETVRADRVIEFEVQDVSAPAITPKEEIPAPSEPVLDTHFMSDTSGIELSGAPKGPNKVLLIGAIAAGLVVAVAGGTWYARKSAGPAQVQVASAVAPAATAPNATQSPARTPAQTATPAPNRSNINSEPVPISPGSASQSKSQSGKPEAQLVKTASEKTAAELSAYKRLAEPQPVAKKPSLGEVHLAAPIANRASTGVVGDAGAGLSLNASQVVPTGDSLGTGLGGNAKQPVAPPAPLPIGGDVKPAALIRSTPPVYPAIAKNQRIEGSVRIDALIDPTGKVSSMKVVSGPVLLHQAAMDALRQWKYQAATLDGKPVAMHLTVTLQFRLQ